MGMCARIAFYSFNEGLKVLNHRTLPKVWGAFLGNFFEHYDTALFTALAPFIAHLFFPSSSSVASLIYAYALIPIGMLARPIGALIFGRIGDLYSRESALFYSMAGMAVVSFFIAICPTYEKVGALGAVLLGACRFLQNLFASGESMGGAIYILEQSPKEKHDLLSGLFSMSTVGGILAASLAVASCCHFGNVEESWRILYLIGCFTGFFGLILRKNRNGEKRQGSQAFQGNFLKTLWEQRRFVAIIALASGFTYSTFSVGLVLMNGFIPVITDFSKEDMIQLNAALLAYMMILLPFLGKLASSLSRELLMKSTLAFTAIFAPFLFTFLGGASFPQIVAVRGILVTLGVMFSCSFHAWAQTLVPKEHRYMILSMGYALGTQLLGGPCSAVSLGLFHFTEQVFAASLYWGALAFVNLYFFIKRPIPACALNN